MASAESQKPTCPVCNRSDDVKTMQAAYESGVDKCAPPDMPTRRVSMMPYVISGAFIIGVCVFLIIVLIGGVVILPTAFQYVLLAITLICIVTALGLSYYAFQKIVRGDNEASELYPAWDRAMATWRSLSYCARDNVVFDPKASTTLTEKQLAELRTMNENAPEVRSAAVAGGQ
jgi:hypothetical protein